jgi:endoglucanase
MQRIGYRVLLVMALVAGHASADPPAALRRGVNVTNWFRYPPSREPAALRAYLDDRAIATLRSAGFTFVRLAVQSDMLDKPAPLIDAIARLERHGLAVVVALFPNGWQVETQPDRLLAAWHTLAPLLARFDPVRTVPEIFNEPVFPNAWGSWAKLQHAALMDIRGALPSSTVVLTGADWGSARGLLALLPEDDANVVYSFHFYDPAEFTSLGAYRPGLDRAAMAQLPFPVSDQRDCEATAGAAGDKQTADLIRFYCALHWDGPKLAESIAEVGNWARRKHVNVIAGEFGASDKLRPDSRVAWLSAVRAANEQQGFGWALWGYDDSMGFGAHPPAKIQLDPAIMRALGLAESLTDK